MGISLYTPHRSTLWGALCCVRAQRLNSKLPRCDRDGFAALNEFGCPKAQRSDSGSATLNQLDSPAYDTHLIRITGFGSIAVSHDEVCKVFHGIALSYPRMCITPVPVWPLLQNVKYQWSV